jgi:FlaA1/EpsC-like NDP-sugar epimerase
LADRNQGLIRPYSATLVELSRGLDALLIIATLWFLARWLGHPWDNLCSIVSLFASLTFVVAGSVNKLYRSWRSDPLHVESSRIVMCWVAAAVTTGFAAYSLDPLAAFPRGLAWWWFLTAPAALVTTRVSIRLLLRLARVKGRNYRKAAIAGSTRAAAQLIETINNAPWMGLKFVGVYETVGVSECAVDLRSLNAEDALKAIASIYDRRSHLRAVLERSMRLAKSKLECLFETLPQ